MPSPFSLPRPGLRDVVGVWRVGNARLGSTAQRPVTCHGPLFCLHLYEGVLIVIITLRAGTDASEVDRVRERIEALGVRTHAIVGEYRTVLGCIGDEALLRQVALLRLPGVESATPVMRPYKLASREFAATPSVVRLGDRARTEVGGPEVVVIAGPCSVEGAEMLSETARGVAVAGARLLRGGAYKPRTSPYAFQGLGERGLELLAQARAESGDRKSTRLNSSHVR